MPGGERRKPRFLSISIAILTRYRLHRDDQAHWLANGGRYRSCCLRPSVRNALINAAIFCGLASCAIFALGAVAAENAMRPPRLAVASVCPCFAHVHCESVAVAARDGISLGAWYYVPDNPNGKAIILLHGIGSNRQDMIPLGCVFLRQGYSVLEPDLRGHGVSGGLTTYGVLEEGDVHAWLDWLDKTGNSPPTYGFGSSLGAAVLLESLQHETRFRAVVAESAYFDFPSIARERIARMLPAGTKWIAFPFVESGTAWARWHDGIDLSKASAADGLKSTRVPVLLIHGIDDNKTSPANSRRLAALNPAVQLWLVPGSHHADAWSTTPAEFESRVTGWFSTH